MKRRVALRELAFYARHGALPHEQSLGQPFYVDVEIGYDFSEAAAEDALGKVIDYRKIYRAVADVMDEGPFNLIETLAERIADRVLASVPVDVVSVRVRKPWAGLGGLSGWSEAAVEKP